MVEDLQMSADYRSDLEACLDTHIHIHIHKILCKVKGKRRIKLHLQKETLTVNIFCITSFSTALIKQYPS